MIQPDSFPRKIIVSILYLLILLSSSLQCSLSQYYDIRSQFLKPVEYTGGLCRVSSLTQQKLLTQYVTATDTAFAKKISRIMAKKTAYFAISAFDPESGYMVSINPNLTFHAASTYKTAILLAVMRMDQDSTLSVKDTILVENNFASIIDGSTYHLDDDKSEPDVTFSQIGQKVSIQDLLNIMIEKSSNLATNILLKHIGIERMNQTLKKLDSEMAVYRGVSDDKAYADCINNLATARDLENLYKLIYSDKIDAAHKKIILETLEKNSEIRRIPAKLPETVKVAHKPGNTSKVFHDAGIVIPESGSPYYITILASQYKSERKTAEAIADVSLLIYQEILKARSERVP